MTKFIPNTNHHEGASFVSGDRLFKCIFKKMIEETDRVFVVLCRNHQHAKLMFSEFIKFVGDIPEWLVPTMQTLESSRTIKFSDHNVIIFADSATRIEGLSINYLYIDDYLYVEDEEKLTAFCGQITNTNNSCSVIRFLPEYSNTSVQELKNQSFQQQLDIIKHELEQLKEFLRK